MGKRLLDIIVSGMMLTFVFPLMVFFALLVKFDSDGPVFYQQLRVGINNRIRARRRLFSRRRARRLTLYGLQEGQRAMNDRRSKDYFGRPFPVLKFRTMCLDAEKNGPVWCQRNDPRVTKIGNFLRKTHLDELPQLINILRGEMSLVGPRPERPEFVSSLTEVIPDYRRRLALKPGLTGLAQIRHQADMVLDDVKRKIRYDFLYMKKASVSTDLKIIMGTVPRVLGVPLPAFRRRRKLLRMIGLDKAFAHALKKREHVA